MTVARIATDLGRLHVQIQGAGPPVMLWHSLFLDSRSWCGLAEGLAGDRMVVAVDGPSHGRSEPITRDFTFADCVTAAEQVLDHLEVTAPVDWVGNAWGGHVGVQFALRRPDRVRTLTTIGTPAHPLRPQERWTKAWPLVQMYRLAGPNALLMKPLSKALVGAETIAAVPDLAATVMSAFTEAHRAAMFHAIRSVMLNRPGMAADMGRLSIPTLLIAARDDITGWQPADARKVADTMADATVVGAAGSGHSSPLLIARDEVTAAVREFWGRDAVDPPGPTPCTP